MGRRTAPVDVTLQIPFDVLRALDHWARCDRRSRDEQILLILSRCTESQFSEEMDAVLNGTSTAPLRNRIAAIEARLATLEGAKQAT